MEKNYLDVLNLLSLCLHGEDTSNYVCESWDKVCEELMSQSVVSLAAERCLSNTDIVVKYGHNLKMFYLILAEQDKIGSILNSNGIPFAILKGTAAAQYYLSPENRTYGDIDFIVPEDKFVLMEKLLNDNGYQQIQTLTENGRHIEFKTNNGIILEPHIKFSSSDDKNFSKIVDSIVSEGLNNRIEVEIKGYKVSVLPDMENGIVLLSHINQHISSGLGLRQIIDWMYYVEAVLDNDFWNKSFSGLADSIGLKKLAIVVTCACKKYLGLKKEITWCDQDINSPIVDEFMLYIMDHGNFGRKDRAGNRTISVLRKLPNPIEGIKYAQKAGVINWKVLKKCPWLKPFAWIYQMLRWVRRGSKAGVKVNQMGKIREKEKLERDFLKRLEVNRL